MAIVYNSVVKDPYKITGKVINKIKKLRAYRRDYTVGDVIRKCKIKKVYVPEKEYGIGSIDIPYCANSDASVELFNLEIESYSGDRLILYLYEKIDCDCGDECEVGIVVGDEIICLRCFERKYPEKYKEIVANSL